MKSLVRIAALIALTERPYCRLSGQITRRPESRKARPASRIWKGLCPALPMVTRIYPVMLKNWFGPLGCGPSPVPASWTVSLRRTLSSEFIGYLLECEDELQSSSRNERHISFESRGRLLYGSVLTPVSRPC
jgi:hypothetical protein